MKLPLQITILLLSLLCTPDCLGEKPWIIDPHTHFKGEEQIAYESKNWGHGALTKALLDLLPQKVADKDTSVTSLLAPLQKNVNRLVVDSSNGRDKQTIHPILNGIPDLKLVSKIKKWGHPFGDEVGRARKVE